MLIVTIPRKKILRDTSQQGNRESRNHMVYKEGLEDDICMQCVTDADGYRTNTGDIVTHKSARTPIVKEIMWYDKRECRMTYLCNGFK